MKYAAKNSTGFTLVEILITVIIIGILAGVLVISASNAIYKADATKIATNMVTLKSACFSYYNDNNNKWPSGLGNGSGKTGANDTKANAYLSQYVDSTIDDNYKIISQDNKILIKYSGLTKLDAGVREALATIAPSYNLWNSSSWNDTTKTNDKGQENKSGQYYYNHYYYTTGNSDLGLNTIHLLVVDLAK